MPSGFDIGLKKFVPRDWKNRSSLKVLSIGCGSNKGVIYNELAQLYLYFGRKPIEYWGVDIEFKSDMAQLEQSLNSQLQGEGVSNLNFKLLQLDASSEVGFRPLLAERFDIVLMRHPQFFSGGEVKTRIIIRRMVPKILVAEGLLIVSLYADDERYYFEPNEDNLDYNMLNCIYAQRKYQHNSMETAVPSRRMIDSRGKENNEDRHMYCFSNVVNTQDTPPERILISDMSSSQREYLVRFLAYFSIAISADDSIMFWPAYWRALVHSISRENSTTTSLATAPQTFFGASTIHNAHDKLISEFTKIRPNPDEHNNFVHVHRSLEEKNYDRALRQVCLSTATTFVTVGRLLLAFGHDLGINPAAENKDRQTAISIARDTAKDHPLLRELEQFQCSHQPTV